MGACSANGIGGSCIFIVGYVCVIAAAASSSHTGKDILFVGNFEETEGGTEDKVEVEFNEDEMEGGGGDRAQEVVWAGRGAAAVVAVVVEGVVVIVYINCCRSSCSRSNCVPLASDSNVPLLLLLLLPLPLPLPLPLLLQLPLPPLLMWYLAGVPEGPDSANA